jgi:hypothetical protein
MTQFLDLDTVELRARTCLESGSGAIDPQTVLELVRLLRAGNKAIGAAAVAPLKLAFVEEPPCSCDESLQLRVKLDLYERAEPNGAIERLRRALNRLTEQHNGDSIREAYAALDVIGRWMVATERRALDAEGKVAELETRLAAPLPSVGGEWVEGTIRDLERAAQLAIGEEQSKANPDSHYIAVFCNTVRLCRESNRLAKGALIQPAPADRAASKETNSDG